MGAWLQVFVEAAQTSPVMDVQAEVLQTQGASLAVAPLSWVQTGSATAHVWTKANTGKHMATNVQVPDDDMKAAGTLNLFYVKFSTLINDVKFKFP